MKTKIDELFCPNRDVYQTSAKRVSRYTRIPHYLNHDDLRQFHIRDSFQKCTYLFFNPLSRLAYFTTLLIVLLLTISPEAQAVYAFPLVFVIALSSVVYVIGMFNLSNNPQSQYSPSYPRYPPTNQIYVATDGES
jgi:hypothetical protein